MRLRALPRLDDASNLALLAVAQLLLRVCAPGRAHAILQVIGACLQPVDGRADARRLARSLGRRGTCLGRALTIAARAPTAEVVIGVQPRPGAPLFAHAWVEVGGSPLEPRDVAGLEIARLRGTGGDKRAL